MSTPGDKVRRQNRKKKSHENKVEATELIREFEKMKDEVARPAVTESEKLRYAKWKIKMLYAYLAFTTVACLGTILINPTLDARLVLALWGSTSATLAVFLRREYKKKI